MGGAIRWDVVVRLNTGIELARYQFNGDARSEIERAVRSVVQAVMDDASLLRPGEFRIDVEVASCLEVTESSSDGEDQGERPAYSHPIARND